MKKITFTKKALALFLAIAMVFTGLYIPKSNVRIVNAEEETEAIEVVEEGTEEVIPENAVAKIGNEYYESFAGALTAAKDSDSAVTITLLKDISDADGGVPTGGFVVQNTAGKKITIDGLDKSERTITAGTTVTNLFDVQCEFELKNVTVDYKGMQTAIKINAATTTSFTNVIIDAEDTGTKSGAKVKDAVIDILAAGTHTLNITNTNITMESNYVLDKETTQTVIKTGAAVGNSPSIKHDTRIVNINLKDSTIDSQDAVGRIAIWITRGTVANVLLDDSAVLASIASNTTSSVKNRAIYAQIVNSGLASGQTAPDLNNDSYIKSKNSTITCMMGTTDYSTPFNFKKCVARIGNQFYETFGAAATAANSASENVTLEFFDDIEIKGTGSGNNPAVFSNANINAITIDGKGHQVEATNGNNTFRFQSSAFKSIQVKNMTIVHKNCGAAIQVTDATSDVQVDVSKVTVTATAPNYNNATQMGYQYALFNVLSKGTSNLTLTDVNVTMAADIKTSSLSAANSQAIIRTGNNGTKTVNITLDDCTLDATQATGRYGISVTQNTSSVIKLKGTTSIKTKDFAPIYDWNVIDTKNGVVSVVKEDCTDVILYCDEKEAQIGYTTYDTFASAITAANASTTDVTIEVLQDINKTFDTAVETNTFGFTNTTSSIAIDGNNHTFTAANGNNTFRFNSGHVGNIALRNMTIDHRNYGAAIQVLTGATVTDDVTTGGTVTIENVTIDATQPSSKYSNQYGYEYALINLLNGKDVVLNMKNVRATMETSKTGHGNDVAIIRTGNTGDEKNVTMILEDCILNSRGATKRYGILIMDKTTADITLKGTTKIETNNVAPIMNKATKEQIVRVEGCTFDSVDAGLKNNPFSGFDAQVGNKVYGVFATAIAEAGAGATVEVLQNLSTGWRDITKSMTIDGNGYEIKSTAGDDNNKFLFVVKGDATEFTLKDLNIKHLRRGMVVRTDIPTTVTLEKVNIDATEAPVSTEYALFNLTAAGTTNLIWNDVTVDMDATTAGLDDNPAIIRTGNDGTKNINITLTDCNLNTEGAAGRHGIVIMSGATATLNLTETTITTLDVLPIKDNTGTATINKTDCNMSYTGIEAVIGNTLYKTFADAVAAANASEEDVTIEIMKEITVSSQVTLRNDNSVVTTFEGNGNKVNTTGESGNAFVIQGTPDGTGTYEFKNMDIDHGRPGVLIQLNQRDVKSKNEETGEEVTTTTHTSKNAIVKLTNVDIANSNNGGYLYGLITTLPAGKDADMRLDLDDVDVTLGFDSDELDTKSGAVIRTGNNDEKSVTINLKDCDFMLQNAAQIRGILVTESSNAVISLTNSNIITKTVAPIEAVSNAGDSTIAFEGTCSLDSLAEEFKTAPIKGYEAQVDDVVYRKFSDALEVANSEDKSVTLKLLVNVTVTDDVKIGNVNGKAIEFDGNGNKTITSAGGNDNTKDNNAFIVNQPSVVRFKDITFIHQNRGSVIQVAKEAAGTELSFTSVTITATNPVNTASNYNYALINVFGSATLNFNQVNVDMDATKGGMDYPGIVRTGNHGDAEKTVTINVNGGNWNTEGATGRHGIVIMKSTNAKVNLKGASITTADAAPIADYSQKAVITRDEETTTTCAGNYKAYVLGINSKPTHTAYATFAEALKAANEFAGDVTLGLLDIVSVGAANIGNAKGKLILDGGDIYKITTENGNHAFTVNQNNEVEFRNMTIEHKRYGAAIQVNAEGATLSLINVFLDAQYPPQVKQSDESYINTYNYALINLMTSSTLNMTNSRAIMVVEALGAGGGNQSSIIRTGNQDDNKAEAVYKEITINLTDCILDTTSATNRSGILVVDAKTDINLKGNTKILTQAGDKCAAIRGLEGTRVAKISMEETCLLKTGESTAYEDVIKNVEERITDACTWTYKQYNNLSAFRTESELKAPTTVPTGYVFAGWYSNKACTAEYALAADDITTTSAYAKFVPDHVIDVKAQLSAELLDGLTEEEKGVIRFVTTVDSLDYTEVGFDYIIQISDTVSKTGTVHSSTVYKTLYAVGDKTSGPISYTPDEAFCGVSQYFKAITIKNIPQSAFDAEITVTPFWVTLDGTKVYGDPATKSVNQGIKAADSEGNVTEDSENTGSVYTNRVVMVSDLHYTTSLEKEIYDKENWSLGAWLSKKLPNASWAAGNAFGYNQEQKLQAALDDINAFGAKNDLDAVMVLGDLTLDDYGYRNLVDNYLDDFKLNFMDKLSPFYATYAIAGNHDSYTNSEWKNTIGTDRQYSVVIGDAVFIMLDTFAAQHATDSNGSAYVGVDIDFLRTELQKAEYADKTIFLCSHYYQQGKHPENDTALNELIANDDRIVCMFRAHSHKNVVGTPSALAGSPLVDIGGYAYNGQQEDDGSYEFNTFDKSWAWGYQVVEWNESEVHIYHVKSARKYTDCNGIEHNYKGAIEGDMVIKIGE